MRHPEDFGMPEYLFNRKNDYKTGKYMHVVSNELDTRLREDLERMRKSRQHRGLRHAWGIRVRGQRTKSTGRCGKTLGVAKKGKK